MADKKQLPNFTSPKGVLKWPKLTEPDFGTKEYPKPEGEFSTKLVLHADRSEVQAFIAQLQPLFDQAVAEGREAFAKLKPETRKKLKDVTINSFYTELLDAETEEPTGEIELKFSKRYSGTFQKGPKTGQKWTSKVDLFDAKGKAMTKAPVIWGGSTGKVGFEVSSYFIPGTGALGLKFFLNAVQVIDLRSGGSKDAAAYGFGAEDGYEHVDSAENDSGFTDESSEGDAETEF
jgi:hypothetical protein